MHPSKRMLMNYGSWNPESSCPIPGIDGQVHLTVSHSISKKDEIRTVVVLVVMNENIQYKATQI